MDCPNLGKVSAIMLHQPEHPETALALNGPTGALVSRQAHTDEQLVDLWLHGRSRHTANAYRTDIRRFVAHVRRPFQHVTLADVQEYADTLTNSNLKPASAHRMLSAVKSLYAFGCRLGYFPFDIARPLRLPGFRDGLADRILDEGQVQRMLALEVHPRNHVLLTLLYVAGLRVSEICALTWNDMQARSESGQVTVFGKGAKTRTILLPRTVWDLLLALRGGAAADAPVFQSRKRGHLSSPQVWRIVRKAAKRAGIERAVSPHWMRHAHASHSLDRGAPIHLVQLCLGHSGIGTTGRYLHARPQDSSANYLACETTPDGRAEVKDAL